MPLIIVFGRLSFAVVRCETRSEIQRQYEIVACIAINDNSTSVTIYPRCKISTAIYSQIYYRICLERILCMGQRLIKCWPVKRLIVSQAGATSLRRDDELARSRCDIWPSAIVVTAANLPFPICLDSRNDNYQTDRAKYSLADWHL